MFSICCRGQKKIEILISQKQITRRPSLGQPETSIAV
jgi:hypothetical protein